MNKLNIGTGKGISVVCKKCNRPAKADQFILDPVYKMMVCPSCVKDRRDTEMIAAKKKKTDAVEQEQKKNKPKNWDAEDEYLEKAQAKAAPKPKVKIIDAEHVKYQCPSCTYKFKYNKVEKKPANCPYCGSGILVR